jgi:hypothetical protein
MPGAREGITKRAPKTRSQGKKKKESTIGWLPKEKGRREHHKRRRQRRKKYDQKAAARGGRYTRAPEARSLGNLGLREKC